ncbi:MAG: pantoate--beta-alanine ligase [Lentisphaeria bacterium]|nr:pantoate--beta-alanine ligase [Lentisphaerota bacterium]MBO7153962.1 pantoate--beta-alanine ligase [Lentisphaeria bacterium]
MQIIRTRKELQQFALAEKRSGKVIGFVPTMGFLHDGHLSLIDIAREKADTVIVSIFVNPTQFAPTEDLDQYPRDFDRDAALCAEHKVDVIFAPEPEEMYREDASTWVTECELSKPLCGASRPTFFRGVTTVVAKLFLLAQPDFAVFGLKDAQQLFVIKRMVRDMDFPIEIIPGALVRDSDGLALSSRNRYLSADERTRALSIHKSLVEARKIIENKGLDAVSEAISGAKEVMTAAGGRVDYVSALDIDTMKEPTAETRQLLLAAACFFGTTRLIDNELIDL